MSDEYRDMGERAPLPDDLRPTPYTPRLEEFNELRAALAAAETRLSEANTLISRYSRSTDEVVGEYRELDRVRAAAETWQMEHFPERARQWRKEAGR